MTYEEMYKAIVENHSEHWGGTFADMMASDKKLKALANEYPELYTQAQADFNEVLSNM